MNRRGILFVAAIGCGIGLLTVFGQRAQAAEEVLKIVAFQEPSSLDLSQFASGDDRIFVENWSEMLLLKDTDGKLVPGVASSWKVSPDGKRIDFTLRKDVKFHSGDRLTSKDVLFSWERARVKSTGVKSGMRQVDRIEIVDDYRITVYFKQPDVLFMYNNARCPVVSKSYYDRVGEDTFVKQPSGTGPYRMVSYKPGEYVDIERFEEYWGKKPPIKKARIYFIPEDTTRVAKLKAGEVDLIQSVPYTEVKALKNDPRFKLIELKTHHPTRSILFGANNPNVPWHDKRVRLAMAYAIDYDSIIKNILLGIPYRLAAIAPGELGYDPTIKPYPYDPKKAKALLAEAGYPNGFDVKFYWSSGGRVSMMQEMTEAIASYWDAIGIRTKPISEDNVASIKRRNNALKPDADYVGFFTASFAGHQDPTQSLYGYFSSQGSRPVYTTPEITNIVSEAIVTTDDDRRAELIKKAVRLIHDDVGIIPVVNNVSIYAMKKNIDFIPTKESIFDFLLVKNMSFK